MKKNLVLIIISIVIVVLLSIFVFSQSTEEILSKFPIFKDLYQNTSLTITSINGIAEISINGTSYGETPLTLQELKEGQYEVTLKRTTTSEKETFYKEHSFAVDLYQNTESVINIEIGPDDSLAGYIIYYTPSPNTSANEGFMTITSNQIDATILIDDETMGRTPLDLAKVTEGEYKIKLSKKGYETVEIPIIIRQGFNLNINAQLLAIPTNLSKQTAPDVSE